MQVKVFSIKLEAGKLEQDQQLLNKFLASVNFKKSNTQFIETENYWSIVVYYEANNTENLEVLERKSFEDLNAIDKQVYLHLKQWRTEKADKLNLKNFMICHNSELIDLAMYKPSNLDELQQIKGFGLKKATKFGDDILTVLNSF